MVGGMCSLQFDMGCSTGPNDDTNPGVGFQLNSPVQCFGSNGHYRHGTGVIGRKDAARLRDALEIFLKNHAAGID